ncbi:hypothetical protein BDP27DRAFT_1214632 [Rhodocollybia butyracea]|uniref:Fe2OG dioxygenase domain-containing protein n=1 Tax=Rhodocollybia butyracea TaxID=206335 RepID=A0A9P5Q268_9AGAR|nr:hypothetical protein BDP27DRAFT_1214632 [Rhodocollybia butyracea]
MSASQNDGKHLNKLKVSGAVPNTASLGAGDSYLVMDLLGNELNGTAFEKVRDEVEWNKMYHRGGEVPRLVAVQGQVLPDSSFPVYRHPSDESPPLRRFTPTVELIRQEVEKVIKHPVNHALIQHYRSGKDYISEHSDKTIDVVRGSSIVNVSLGAQRTMTLRTKKDQLEPVEGAKRTAQRFPLPHASMFVMGLETNRQWLHAINQDNRMETLKVAEELQQNGERISLTFRYIGTFLDGPEEKMIYGQGATGKTREQARLVINGPGPETDALLEAFGKENRDTNFVWDEWYGKGSDVLHFTD